MENYAALTVIFALFLVYSLLARHLAASILSGPMLFTGLGFGLWQSGVSVLTPTDHNTIELLATATLAIILFRDAANIRISSMMAERATAMLTLRLLFIGIPLTILAGTLAGMALFPALGFFVALILAVVPNVPGQHRITGMAGLLTDFPRWRSDHRSAGDKPCAQAVTGKPGRVYACRRQPVS